MKIVISTVETCLSRRVIEELQNGEIQFGVVRLDRKLTMLIPINWNGILETEGWVYSCMIDEARQTVLLRAEMSDSMSTNNKTDVKDVLRRLNRNAMDGAFMVSERENAIGYYVGPIAYDPDDASLEDILSKMGSAVRRAASVIEGSALVRRVSRRADNL